MPRYSWTRLGQTRSSAAVVLVAVAVSSNLGSRSRPSTSAEESEAPTSVFLAPSSRKNETSHSHAQQHRSHLSSLAPIPPIRVFRPNPYLEIAYDVRTRNPVYVLEQLQPEQWETSKGNNTRRPHFYEEKMLPEQYRSRNSHYRGTEYDRGHMAPAADFAHDREQLVDTFTLCNTSPQLPRVNRKVWAALEEWTRRVALAAHKQTWSGNEKVTTYVLTGPLFLPAEKVSDKVYQYHHAAIGQPPALQSVPTHFFKVVVVVLETSTSRYIQAFSCFVVPNHESAADETDLTRFVVPWTALETVSGLELFPALTTTTTTTSSASSVDWKASADAVTRAITQNYQPTLLLLTDGNNGSKRNQKRRTPLKHLCAQGQCQRPYKLLPSTTD
jgi:endonuclease G